MAFVGVLMLQTRFPRPLGDIGNPLTFEALRIPARHLVVRGASPQRVVRHSDAALLADFSAAALQLVREGASMISTSCGFLALFQQQLQQAVPVPVLSSSLLWLPRLGPSAGVLSIDALALTPAHLAAVAAAPATPIGGVATGCEFQRRILGDDPQLDPQQACADVVAGAQSLLAQHPGIGTIVLECSNMVPYAAAVTAATGRPVEHIISLIEATWMH